MSTIEKALGLLEHFSAQSPEIGLSEFKRLSRFDKGTVHRYLTALRDSGFLEQNAATKAYRLGPAVIRLAAVREKTVPLAAQITPYINDIAKDFQELVHAALPQANGMSMLYAIDGGNSGTRVAFDEAEILPFHATSSGLAQLAFGPPELLEKALSAPAKVFTQMTARSPDQVKALVDASRAQGFALSNQSFETDVCSVAVPFFDHSRHAIGTIAIATPAARMTDTMRARAVSKLTTASTELSAALGGEVPPTLNALWAA